MAERIRLIIDTDDTIRRAVQLRRIKAGAGKSNSDIVNDILRRALAREIAEIEGFSPVEEDDPPAAPRKKRQPKQEGE